MKNKETRQARYARNRMKKSILIDMYLADPIEKKIYESWKNESHKKGLFIKLYSDYLSKNDS